MTQSDGPAVSGGFDYAADGGYAGIWGSNVNFNNGAGSELDYYFGYGTEMGSVGVDIGYIKFDYPDSDPDISFEEIYVGLSMGDLGLLFAMGQDGAPDYTEVSYGFGAGKVCLTVNTMIMVIIWVFHMVLDVVPMIAQ